MSQSTRNELTLRVVRGGQAHVCVEQTSAELVERGYTVHVVADAVGSRSQEDRLLAFQVREELRQREKLREWGGGEHGSTD